jgi:hypothetical protein
MRLLTGIFELIGARERLAITRTVDMGVDSEYPLPSLQA